MTTLKLTAISAILGIGLGLGYSLIQSGSIGFPGGDATAGPVQPGEKIDYLPSFSYPDLQGNTRSSEEWSDKVVVLNFWASWCPPCKKETPAFIATQARYPDLVQFVGIAIDDREPVLQFANDFGINYPTLLGDMNAVEISKQLGNRYSALPFTAIFDKNGKLVFQHTGEVREDDLEKQLSTLL